MTNDYKNTTKRTKGKQRKQRIFCSWLLIAAFVFCLTSCTDNPTPKEKEGKATTAVKKQTDKQRSKDKAKSPKVNENKAESGTDIYKHVLESEISDVNKKLPMQVENGVTVTKFTVEGNDAVYYYTCDENIISLNTLKSSKSQMHTNILASLTQTKDPETIHLLSLLYNAEMGMTYKYVSKKNGKTIELKFTPQEILQTKR